MNSSGGHKEKTRENNRKFIEEQTAEGQRSRSLDIRCILGHNRKILPLF